MERPKPRLLGEILKSRFGLAGERLVEALAVQREKGGRIGEILVRLGHVKEDAVLEALGEQFGVPYARHLSAADVDKTLAAKVPIAFAKRFEVLPLREAGGVVQVATAHPSATGPLDDLRLLLAKPVAPVVASARAILACIHQTYERSGDSAEQVIEDLGAETLDRLATALEEEPRDLLEAADEAPIIKLVNSLLFEAVKKRASDIHIEPFERELLIRYRIDGVLYNVLTPPKRLQASIISRIKIMAGLNIAEKRLPQDGRIGIKIAGRDVDIRVSAIPTAHGERLVLRLLDKGNLLLKLSEIGLQPARLATLDQLIRLSHGIVLVTGPTGSGKTNTLYSSVSRLNSPDTNIVTAEDPVEFQLHGINQVQMKEQIGLNFASALRSFLRQDPNIILVGEIRDFETAEVAIKAALTGHLVLSTLHTNDAPSTISRLMNMGIEPFLVATSVQLICAQRLVRRICTNCKVEHKMPLQALIDAGYPPQEAQDLVTYKGKGCEKCNGSGGKGRVGLYEVMEMTEELRELVLVGASALELRKKAVELGMITLRRSGLIKVREGLTTLEEVVKETVL